jgi:hypothetical protein
MNVYIYIHIRVYIFILTYVYIHIYICIDIYIYIHIYTGMLLMFVTFGKFVEAYAKGIFKYLCAYIHIYT